MEQLSNDREDHLKQHKKSNMPHNKTGDLFFEFIGKSMETETTA